MAQKIIIFLLIGFISLGIQLTCWGAGYPSKPIQMVQPFGPGGSTDLGSKIISSFMEKYLGQPLIPVYKPGGGTTIATKFVMSSKPDGYTVKIGNPENVTFYPRIVKGADYGVGAITPLFGYGQVPMAVCVKEDAPWKTLGDFIVDAKKHVNQYKHGSYGAVSFSHFLMELINHYAGTQTRHVPFASPGEMMTSLLGGHVDIVGATGAIGGLLKANKIRVLAASSANRTDLLPGVPILKELGYPIVITFYHGFWAPNGTPQDIQNILIQAGQKALTEHYEEIKKQYFEVEMVPAWADQEAYKKIIMERKQLYDFVIDLLKVPTYDKK